MPRPVSSISLLATTLPKVGRQRPGSVMYRDDLSVGPTEPVHDAVGASKQFPKRRIGKLGNYATGLRKRLELVHGDDKTSHQQPGRAQRVVANVLMDGVEVIAGLRSPVDSRHNPKRALICSCGMS